MIFKQSWKINCIQGICHVILAALRLQWSRFIWELGPKEVASHWALGSLSGSTCLWSSFSKQMWSPGEEVQPSYWDPAHSTHSGQQGAPGDGQSLGHGQLGPGSWGALRVGERAERGLGWAWRTVGPCVWWRRNCRAGIQVRSRDPRSEPGTG